MVDYILPQNNIANVDETDFQGTSQYNITGMYYLSHKSPNNICVISGEPYEVDEGKTLQQNHVHSPSCMKLPMNLESIPSEQTGVSLRWLQKNESISVPKPKDKFWKNFLRCTDKRFIALPFGYNCNSSGHANYILFDKKQKTLERFESFGKVDSSCLANPKMDKKIEELFKENLKNTEYENFTYKKPLSFLPEDNVQTIQEEESRWKNVRGKNPVGFCSVWSLWYIDLRTSNPDADPLTLIKWAIKKIRQQGTFTDFIRRYSLLFVDTNNQIENLYDGGGGNGCYSSADGRRQKRSRNATKTKRSLPKNLKLYNQVKKEIFSRYPKPSAYRSGRLVKEYKKRGGTYKGKKSKKQGLIKWFKEFKSKKKN